MNAKRKKEKEQKSENLSFERANELEKEIFALRNERAIHRKLEKPHLLKEKRHERARL